MRRNFMPTKREKQQRKELRRTLQHQQDAQALATMPLTTVDLRALFDHLDEQLPNQGCDNTLRITRAFLASRQLEANQIIPWLGEYGGFCDCEVLANVEEAWEPILASTPDADK